jgi:hypothetical protein
LAVAAIESRARHQQFVQRQPWRVKVGPLVASALEAFVSAGQPPPPLAEMNLPTIFDPE